MSDCPKNMMVSPTPSPELLVNTTLTCSSSGGAPSPFYHWLNGSIVAAVGSMITLTEPGPFFLTCLANSSYNGIDCFVMRNVSGTVVLGLLNVFMQSVKCSIQFL